MKAPVFALVLVLTSHGVCASQDPSLLPIPHGERYRLRKDLNGDGRLDLILSLPRHTFGNGGGGWDVYLSTADGDFALAGRIGAQVGFIRSEIYHQTYRIWYWWRGGAWVGSIGYYELKDGKVGEPLSIEVHAGDGGNDLGRALFEAVFPNGADPDLEASRTEGGRVEWEKVAEQDGRPNAAESPR